MTMIGNIVSLITKGTSVVNPSTIFSPSFPVFLVTIFLLIVVVIAYSNPGVGNIFYQAYLDIMPTKGPQEVHEGFLLEAPANPDTRETVISRQDLLQRLQGHMNRITLPYGLTCDNLSVLSVESYLKRLSLTLTQKVKDFDEWVQTTYRVFKLSCKEQKLISTTISKIQQDSVNEYSFNDLRRILEPLLKFYDTARVLDNRFRSRKEVNQIFGLPIGEREPRNQTILTGYNSFVIKTSTHDTGDNPNKASDYNDPIMYANLSGDIDVLPTQTNELSILNKISDISISRASTNTRGGNA